MGRLTVTTFDECPTGGRDVCDDADDYALSCTACGEPHHRSKASKHVRGLCLVCCPVRRAKLQAEYDADLAWDRAHGILSTAR